MCYFIFSMKYKIFLCFIIFKMFCNQYFFSNALIGYNIKSIKQNEFPNTVCISRHEAYNLPIEQLIICTGTFISETHVLTAHHCFNNAENESLQVIARFNNTRHSTIYDPIWWISYEHWASQRNKLIPHPENDIAILKLIGILPDIITLPLSQVTPNSIFNGLNVQSVGCGISNNGLIPMIMETMLTKVISNANCEEIISRLQNIHLKVPDHYMCSRNFQYYSLLSDADAGGPVFFFGTLVAVNVGVCPSLSSKFHPEKVNIHAGIDFYREYIHEVINLI